jgi:hypothetical protein
MERQKFCAVRQNGRGDLEISEADLLEFQLRGKARRPFSMDAREWNNRQLPDRFKKTAPLRRAFWRQAKTPN